jgi:katanin p60 ATPase-containing subunit A1
VRIHAHASARDRPLIISRSQAFERDSLRAEERERALLVLARRFLADNGFAESARCLARESDASLSRSDAAPDAHLRGVLREWQDARERATGVRPRLTSRKSETGKGVAARAAAPGRAGATAGAERRAARLAAEREALRAKAAMLDVKDEEDKQKRNEASKASRVNDGGPSFPNAARVDDDGGVDDVFSRAPPGHPLLRRYAQEGGVSAPPPGGTALSNALEYFANRKREPELEGGGDVGPASTIGDDDDDWASRRRVLRPLPSFGGDAELRGLAKTLTRDIFVSNPNVRWGDVAGLGEAKRLLREAVVMPARFPQFFTGLLKPWRGVLLYGPPGTGKTMLAKAVATECGTTFFNISASSIVSKWRGDSEKLVRVLFELARYHAPSTVFLDEIDAVMSTRDGGTDAGAGNDHEASRRMKTELLIQLDGLHTPHVCGGGEEIHADDHETHTSHPLVFLLAATNTPWSLDPALLRRLEKRVSVGLPDGDARAAIAHRLFRSRDVAEPRDSVLEPLSLKTEGYSGSDIATLCKETAMRPLRRLMARLDDESSGDGGGGSVSDAEKATVGPVTAEDVAGALAQSRSTHTQTHARRYEEWTRSFGMDAG